MSGQQSGSESKAGVGASLALKDIFKLLKREIESTSLQPIDADTFQKIASALGSIKGQGYEGIEAKIRDSLADLIANAAGLLIETRLYKMRTSPEPLDYSKLTDEEKYVLHGLRESGSRKDEFVAATSNGRVKVLESISSRVRSKQIVVRFLKPIESFVGVDMNKYGPFQQEDVASLPFENARSMVESGVAVQIHVDP